MGHALPPPAYSRRKKCDERIVWRSNGDCGRTVSEDKALILLRTVAQRWRGPRTFRLVAVRGPPVCLATQHQTRGRIMSDRVTCADDPRLGLLRPLRHRDGA